MKKIKDDQWKRCQECGGSFNGNVEHNHMNPFNPTLHLESFIEDLSNEIQKVIHQSGTKIDVHNNVDKFFTMMLWKLKNPREVESRSSKK